MEDEIRQIIFSVLRKQGWREHNIQFRDELEASPKRKQFTMQLNLLKNHDLAVRRVDEFIRAYASEFRVRRLVRVCIRDAPAQTRKTCWSFSSAIVRKALGSSQLESETPNCTGCEDQLICAKIRNFDNEKRALLLKEANETKHDNVTMTEEETIPVVSVQLLFLY